MNTQDSLFQFTLKCLRMLVDPALKRTSILNAIIAVITSLITLSIHLGWLGESFENSSKLWIILIWLFAFFVIVIIYAIRSPYEVYKGLNKELDNAKVKISEHDNQRLKAAELVSWRDKISKRKDNLYEIQAGAYILLPKHDTLTDYDKETGDMILSLVKFIEERFNKAAACFFQDNLMLLDLPKEVSNSTFNGRIRKDRVCDNLKRFYDRLDRMIEEMAFDF